MIEKHKLDGEVGERLKKLHDSPRELYFKGVNPSELIHRPTVAIVGSRKMTPYGRAITEQLTRELVRAGVVIISGLALGVDSAAHRACIEAGGQTIAVLPSSPDMIYPSSHYGLAKDILKQGGSLVSEYPEATPALKYTFIARNRIIAAFADAVLIPEASLKSGSLHTSTFALDMGIPVMAVPGPINSATSTGTNDLIKNGAIPVTSVQDILETLGITAVPKSVETAVSFEEKTILNALESGVREGSDLLHESGLESSSFAQTLTMLEISGRVRSLGADQWSLC